jgi:hypothetical protein
MVSVKILYHYPFVSSRTAMILCHGRLDAEAMYYYPSASSSAAAILLWGRLPTWCAGKNRQ